MDFQYVRALERHRGQDAGEHSGPIGHTDRDHHPATLDHQAALDDPGDQVRVDVSPGDRAHHLGGGLQPLDLVLQERGCGGGPRPFRHRLLPLDQSQDGVGHLFVVHADDLVDVLAEQRERPFSSPLDGDSVRERGRVRDHDRPSSVESGAHLRQMGGLDTDDPHRGLQRLHRQGHPTQKASAPDRGDQHVDVRHLLQDLQRRRPLAGDDRVIVEGMDEDEALLFLQPARLGVGIVVVVAAEHDLRAELACGLDLAERGRLRHHDGGLDAEPLRVDGDALRVVAGAGSHHPALALVRSEQRELVRRAALLEGAGAVQVLQLEVDPGPAQLAERLGERAGGDRHDSADAVACRDDVLQGDHRGGRVTASAIPVKMWCGMKAHASRVV